VELDAMKIALINPPFTLDELVGTTKSMKRVMNVIQPLGLGYLAAVLEQDGHEVSIEDCQCLGTSHSELTRKLSEYSPDIIGISSTTPTFASSIRVATLAKAELPDVLVVIGGAQVCAVPEETMSFDCFDVGVIGEGERTAQELVTHLDALGTDHLDRVKGIVFRQNGSTVQTEKRPFINNLDELPYPARHLLPPLDKYQPTPATHRRLPHATLITSRGCAGARCVFCDRRGQGFTVRYRSIENVMGEVEELINVYGARDLKFFDDTFTLNPKRAIAICNEFKKRHLDITWACCTRTNTVTKELLKTMKDAGCWEVEFGVEALDEDVLEKLGKLTTVEDNVHAIKWCHEVGIKVRAQYIIGTPFHTREAMETTLKKAIKLNTHIAHFNKFTPYPGCELYRMLSAQGYKYDFTNWHSQLDLKGEIMYTPPGMTTDEYGKWAVEANRRYYLRAAYIAKELLGIRSYEDLRGLWNGFLAISGL
jgi:anaerobic magnesium-protoporphyrin IX monomethyl ester cyclase